MRPRVVVAGQIPPPICGQHLAVQELLLSLETDGRFDVDHLRYAFATTMESQGSFHLTKATELLRIVTRLVRLRARGRIDLLVHPIGGTSRSAAIRDVIVVALARTVSRHTVLQFHGGGHGRAWADRSGPLVGMARRVLGGADAAIVHAEVNRVDPDELGVRRVFVAPHRIADDLKPELVNRPDAEIRVLYLGHLGPQRGTPALVDAFAALARRDQRMRLTLAGSPVGEYDIEALRAHVVDAGVEDRVELAGEVSGERKDRLFGQAHVFAFPSVFEAESFGLVLAEALMWGLPVVATDWRANGEVLAGAEAIVHRHHPDLSGAIFDALATAVRRIDSGAWPPFSARNRQVFEERYRRTTDSGAVSAIAAVLGIGDASTAPGLRRSGGPSASPDIPEKT